MKIKNSLNDDRKNENLFALESRRYIGNKAKLTNWIEDIIKKEIKDCNSFLDLFAGTGIVSKSAFKYFDNILINDLLDSNKIVYEAFFKPGKWNKKKLENVVEEWNKMDVEKLKENYFSKNFGNKFFELKTARAVGEIREQLEISKNNYTKKELFILLASMLYSIDRVANTVGHFDAYIKKPIKNKKIIFKLINTFDIKGVKIYQEDANSLIKKVKADVVYIDPPYNSRQYSRFYHIYENLVNWKKPKLYGVAMKPTAENMSVYCTVKAKDSFENLIQNISAKYIIVSYNNTYGSKSSSSENKIKLEEIIEILNAKGKTMTFENSYKFFNTGKTDFNNHKEIIFLTKINGK
jgi:adenine-specific DNA-methyltransferase